MGVRLPWSYTAWDIIEQCPLKYKLGWLDGLRPTGLPAPWLVKGRDAHTAMEQCMYGAPIPPICSPKLHDYVNVIRACEDKLVEHRLVVDRDWKMVKGTTAWLVVKCDIVRQDEAMTVVTIDDWKTGKTKAATYAEQMSLYRATAASVWPADHYVVNLANLEEGKVTTSTVSRADALLDVEKWTERATELETRTDWEPRPNEYCGNCEFGRQKGGPCRFG